MQNLNLLFNKTYFSKLDLVVDGKKEEFEKELDSCNREIIKTKFNLSDYKAFLPEDTVSKLCPHRFVMKTRYPGLLVGTGYTHEAMQGLNNCIKLGFSFDYVTGQPYIPGSSVKGMLKSCFENSDVIAEILNDLFKRELSATDIDDMKKQIFEGGDIFFDAVIRKGDSSGYLLGLDYITPHPQETKAPNPLLMLKLMPEVEIEFRFSLTDLKLGGNNAIWANEKRDLFIKLIEYFGVGAKTNVGYGVLEFVCNIDVQRKGQGSGSV